MENAKKDLNNAISLTAQLEKTNDKLRNQLVHAKDLSNNVKKEN